MTHLLLAFSLLCFALAGVLSEYRTHKRLTWLDEDEWPFMGKPNAYLQRQVDEIEEEWRRIYGRGN